MVYRYIALALTLAFLTAARLVTDALDPRELKAPPRLLDSSDAESRLARGERLPFSAAGIYDLQLIPGVGEKTAHRLIERKGHVHAQSLLLPPDRRHEALLVVFGIGPRTAVQLSRYLAVGE